MGGNGATPVITAARGASNLFQTPDGRIFAFSNGAQPITPGQLFQVKLLFGILHHFLSSWKLTGNAVRPQASDFQKHLPKSHIWHL